MSVRYFSISEMRQLLLSRELSAVELVDQVVDDLEVVGRGLNAVAAVDRDVARVNAADADDRLRTGKNIAPLTGIPFGPKDLLATRDLPTRWGSPYHANQQLDYDATVIARLRGVGSVLAAKVAMVALAGAGGYRLAAASADGPGINPWDEQRWAGGSSSGSAAVVAAGLLPFTLGSETGGSIMIPSSFCGVTGLRPTYGAVSRYGVMPVSWSMDKIGPIARSAEDCELVFAAIAGHDPLDPTTSGWRYRPRKRRTYTIGVLPNDCRVWPDTGDLFEAALSTLAAVGMQIRPANPTDIDYRAVYRPLLAEECAAAHNEFINGPGIDLLPDIEQRGGLRQYLQIPRYAYVKACEERVAAARAIRAMFEEVDILAAPTVLTSATRLSDDLGRWREHWHYAVFGALAGIPGISLPMGFDSTGLPIGLTLMADRFNEAYLFDVGRLYQRSTDWHLRKPYRDCASANHREDSGTDARAR